MRTTCIRTGEPCRVVPCDSCPNVAQHSHTTDGRPSILIITRPMQLDQEELHEALSKLVARIEACGASPELTAAVTLCSDIRQAVGNQWNSASPEAAQRVKSTEA